MSLNFIIKHTVLKNNINLTINHLTFFIFVCMKKWLIIFFAFLQLASTTQLSQLYKLPIFISHFLEHSNNKISFEELENFIVHHYNGHEMDDDWEIDQKLPFMNADRVHLDPCFVSNFEIPYFPIFSKEINIPEVIFDDQIVTSTYLESIWHPPKHA